MIIYFSGGILFSLLIALALHDLKTFRLPDALTFPLIAMGLIFAYVQGALGSSILGAGIAYIGFVALEVFYKRLRGINGLGRGDAKLFAAGGAWCGWYGLTFIILIASATGLVHALFLSKVNRKDPIRIPFGPHLAFGIFMTWLALFLFKSTLI